MDCLMLSSRVCPVDSLRDARLLIYRAIIARFSPGPERERWLLWLNSTNGRRCKPGVPDRASQVLPRASSLL